MSTRFTNRISQCRSLPMTVAFIFAVCILAWSPLPAKAEGAAKPVTIKYVENIASGKAIAGAEIYFAYYDVGKDQLMVLSAKANSEGMATFNVPLSKKNGPSYSFVWRTSAKDIEEAKANIKNLRMFRIPEGEPRLELWIDKDGGMSNKKGAIQIWSFK